MHIAQSFAASKFKTYTSFVLKTCGIAENNAEVKHDKQNKCATITMNTSVQAVADVLRYLRSAYYKHVITTQSNNDTHTITVKQY